MKYFLFIISSSILLFTGCVNTYTINDFKSPKEFYNEVNKKVNDRSVKVVTNGDSAFDAEKMIVKPDSVSFTIKVLPGLKDYKTVYMISDIKKIYTQTDFTNGAIHSILLNNGDIISSKGLVTQNDSVFINNIVPEFSLVQKDISLPTGNVNTISFNNHFKGAGEGAAFSAMAGVLFAIRKTDFSSGDQEYIPPEITAVAGAIVFGLGGAVIGTATGSCQQYIFNEKNFNYHGFSSIELAGGINTSCLFMSLNNTKATSTVMVNYSAGLSFVWNFNNNIGLKSGLFYNSLSGSFGQFSIPLSYYYNRDIFVNLLNVPIEFQYTFRQFYSKPRIYAGPELGFFLSGTIDNLYNYKDYYSSPRQMYYKAIYSKDVNSPEVSFVIGAGFNFQKYITINVMYDYGLSKFSNSLFDGEVKNIKLSSFSVLLGYGI
ncbi:MAG: outer membrane beta-barrel protein [Ignavibacteriaceae bacterium]|nr:outer membrane beta-barrel protein [Ignavibacteriaceae bacterium]